MGSLERSLEIEILVFSNKKGFHNIKEGPLLERGVLVHDLLSYCFFQLINRKFSHIFRDLNIFALRLTQRDYTGIPLLGIQNDIKELMLNNKKPLQIPEKDYWFCSDEKYSNVLILLDVDFTAISLNFKDSSTQTTKHSAKPTVTVFNAKGRGEGDQKKYGNLMNFMKSK